MHVPGRAARLLILSDLPSKKIRDIRGERFGRLVVKEFSHIAPDKGKNAYWKCSCDCGGENTISSAALRTGSTQSCGCYASEVSRQLIKNTHNKGKHLYFIRSGPYVKIGRANNINMRLTQLRAMNPHGVELIHYVENAGHLEHSLHKRFKEFLYSGEWFLLDDEEVVTIGDV